MAALSTTAHAGTSFLYRTHTQDRALKGGENLIIQVSGGSGSASVAAALPLLAKVRVISFDLDIKSYAFSGSAAG